ncbi:uncharacterized protein LOC113407983 [Terrapene carolina triunguis]|uniref:uncharacterized protein LOC113407983 n=1 Tax=Terrapene triunguis TaxID=2587831 RepID=UPI001156622F|nr:uncharacterized protein LOC113407983 [Terrapene carolina triunguis]
MSAPGAGASRSGCRSVPTGGHLLRRQWCLPVPGEQGVNLAFPASHSPFKNSRFLSLLQPPDAPPGAREHHDHPAAPRPQRRLRLPVPVAEFAVLQVLARGPHGPCPGGPVSQPHGRGDAGNRPLLARQPRLALRDPPAGPSPAAGGEPGQQHGLALGGRDHPALVRGTDGGGAPAPHPALQLRRPHGQPQLVTSRRGGPRWTLWRTTPIQERRGEGLGGLGWDPRGLPQPDFSLGLSRAWGLG